MRKSQRQRANNNSSSLGSMWLITGSLILLFIGGLHYLNTHNKAPTKTVAVVKHDDSVKTQSPSKVTAAEPQFDFYTLLPQSKVEVPKSLPTPKPTPIAKPSIAKSPISNPTANINKALPSNHFILQVASVKDATVADHLKAELTLLGFDVNVQKIKVSNVVWNRVNLGPYASADAAQADQGRLKKNNINSILLKVK